MVAPIRELGNITLSATTLCSSTYNMAIDFVNDLFTDNEVRNHSLALSVHKSRSLSIFSSKSDKEYDICVKRDSDRMGEDEPVSPIGNSQVYNQEKEERSSQQDD